MKLYYIYALFSFFLNFFSIEAYVFQVNDQGKILKWPRHKEKIYFWVDNGESSDVTSSQFLDYVSETASRWNNVDVPSIHFKQGIGRRVHRNDITFDRNNFYFSGNSVLAVTQMVFQESNGKILETDIILRDTNGFSSDLDKREYFESLLAHEMGHALGLDHGQVHGSTMFYSFGTRQRILHTDDIAGARVLYKKENTGVGKISGVVVGKNSKTGVFGAHVQAVSSLTGKVFSGTITEEDGSFSIGGLPLDDVYFLYISPSKVLSTLSNFYKNIRSNFCSDGGAYAGSFFRPCGNTRQGHPQGVFLDKSKDVGIITIKCGLDVPKGYLAKRDSSDFFELSIDEENGGNAITGFFSNSDINNRRSDRIRVDLRDLEITERNLFFEIKLTSQDLYSLVKWDMRVESPDGTTNNYTRWIGPDGHPELNLIARPALDSFNPGNNVFDITITPTHFFDFITGDLFSSEDYFSSINNFAEDSAFYLLIMNISQSTMSGYKLYSHYNYEPLRDNSECVGANKTFAVKSSRSASLNFPSDGEKEESRAMTCGSISFNGGGPGQIFFSLFIGFLATFLVFGDARFKYFSIQSWPKSVRL